MTSNVDMKVTVTAHPASAVSLSPNDLLRHPGGSELSATQLAEASHEWRVMRFNGVTRQSVCRVVAAAGQSEVLPVPTCIATEYLKSMIASGAHVHHPWSCFVLKSFTRHLILYNDQALARKYAFLPGSDTEIT